MARTLPAPPRLEPLLLDVGRGRPAAVPALHRLRRACSTRRRRCAARAAATSSMRRPCRGAAPCRATPRTCSSGRPTIRRRSSSRSSPSTRTRASGSPPTSSACDPETVAGRHAGAGGVRARRRRLGAAVRTDRRAAGRAARRASRARAHPLRAADGARREVRGPGRAHRHRHVADRPQAHGRRRCRSPSRRSGRRSTTPGSRWTTSTASRPIPATAAEGGYAEGGVTAVESALGIRPTWHNGGHETPGATGSLDRRDARRRRRACAATSSASAPSGSRATASWRKRGEVAGAGRPSGVRAPTSTSRPYGVQAVQHGGDGRVAAHGALRHDAGVARVDRPQRAGQRRAQPDRGLPRPAHDGRLPRRPARSARRSACTTATRCATARWPSSCRPRRGRATRRTRSPSRPSACRSPSGWSGTRACSATSRTCSGRPPTSGPARRSARTTSTSPSSTTASRFNCPLVDRGARLLRDRRGQGLPRRRQEHRPRRPAAAEHQRRAAVARSHPRHGPRARGRDPAARATRRRRQVARRRDRGSHQRRAHPREASCCSDEIDETAREVDVNVDDMIILSIDDHAVEPPDLFEQPPAREVQGPGAAARPRRRTARSTGSSRARSSGSSGSTPPCRGPRRSGA